MRRKTILSLVTAALASVVVGSSALLAATTIQVGESGKTYASSFVECATNPSTGELAPVVEAGLFEPRAKAKATVSLNGTAVASVTAASPATDVWLVEGANSVTVTLSKKVSDSYAFSVAAGACSPDTSGNTFSADGAWEYGASGNSSATVSPGCAWNPATGGPAPYVHLVDNGGYLLNVSVNGVPLTRLSATHPSTPVFLSAGKNVISVAHGTLSTDYYIRDGGTGTCDLP